MASVTEPPQPNSPPRAPNNREQVVDQQISQTRRAIKMVDFTAGMITLVIGVLGYLLTMAVLEHWVIPGGWSNGMRLVLFAVLLVGIGVYSWRTFWPLLMQSINPIYAAQAIEQNSPSLKNSLLNLLLLRNNKQHMTRQVYQAIEQQAAQRLSQVKMESTVDRSIILRLGYILVALTAIAVLYRFLSPKDPISSIGRVLMPWSEIATPSRVEILNVAPGETKVAQGEQLTITAEVHGLEADEPVKLLYSTVDEQIVGQELLMTAAEGEAVFSCRVPGHVSGLNRNGPNHNGTDGIQQDLTYWIEAGDARSSRYPVTVYSRPTLVVQRLRYEYPTYTGIPTREVEHTGDIRAVEGTRVTIYAQANKPIKAAHIDFDADGRRDLLMNANDQLATATFPLELRDDRRTPTHKSYLLRFLTLDGNENQQPPKYQIDVQPDFSPEITLLLPEEPMLEVALNKEVQFEVEARDPDFALSHVVLIGKLGEKRLFQEKLLKQSNHTGRFVGKLHKTPEEMGLKVGDVLEYWGAAADNRRPKANLAYSVHRKIRVTGPWQGNPNKDQKPEGEDSDKQQPNDGEQSGESERGQKGQEGGGEESSGGGEADESEDQEDGEGDGSEMNEDSEQNSNGGKGGKGQQDSDEESGADGNNDEMTGDNAEGSDDPSDDQAGNESAEGGTGGDNQGKVSSEGDDDGAAFDRMADHFDKQDEDKQDGESGDEKNQSGEQRPGEQGDTADGKGAKDNGKAESSTDAADGKIDSDQSGGEDEGNDSAAQAREDASKGQDASQAPFQEKDPGESASADGEAQSDSDSNEADDSGEQEGGDQQGDNKQEGNQQGEQNTDQQNNEMSPEQGDQGAGNESGEDQGAPNSDDTKKSQEKQGDSGQGGEKEGADPASSAQDETESDSKDGQGGDRSGGGEKGAGQQSDESGKGAGGENETADDGKGKSSEQGDGETGEKAGDQKTSDGETGESSGDQAGGGNEQSGKSQGEDASKGQDASPKDPGESASADGEAQQNPPQPGEEPNSPPANSPPSTGNGGTSPENEVQPGDAANLEHAKKQTDLILERLEDQLNKKEVDQKLLDKLGWNKDELQRFVNRWKNLKSQADKNTNEKTADQELNDALRSLGLNKKRRTGYRSKITKDKLRDLQDAYRGRVPLEFQDQIRSYHKGTATSQESE